ncbi:hypothetical protein DPMN_002380 [Dreissena polymorpha]|uniref:Uncharacterized protein n=1 Tax=Dreissena polymorpha TaxID=45954 RepID=A0A9D4MMQ2_DREPO|nr:hypothetical protein DPMN_002380 [Dreissena polymorpha]
MELSIIFMKEAVFKLIGITQKALYNRDPDNISCRCEAPDANKTEAGNNSSGLLSNVTLGGNVSSTVSYVLGTVTKKWDKIHPDFCEAEGGRLHDDCKHVEDVFFFS